LAQRNQAARGAELLEVLRTGQAVDAIRESVRMVLPELIKVEASEPIGAARYERRETRINERNGSRPRMLANRATHIDLRTPSYARVRSSRSSSSHAGASTRRCTRW
jgi:transposase-like protein